MRNNWCNILFLLCTVFAFAQEKTGNEGIDESVIKVKDTIFSKQEYNPLAPAKAAFYSAVIPGLGQAYNKKYWKIPIIYAGMATGVYFYIDNNKDYNLFRDAYKRRLAGFTDDQFYGDGDTPIVSNDRLINAQRRAQKNKDYSIVTVIAFYALNIIDANVDAHLKQYDISEDLSLGPEMYFNSITQRPNYGLSLKLSIK